jgi:AMMECR1 domain-containing protein
VAAKAALEDSRFPRVTPAELADLEYEVLPTNGREHVDIGQRRAPAR